MSSLTTDDPPRQLYCKGISDKKFFFQPHSDDLMKTALDVVWMKAAMLWRSTECSETLPQDQNAKRCAECSSIKRRWKECRYTGHLILRHNVAAFIHTTSSAVLINSFACGLKNNGSNGPILITHFRKGVVHLARLHAVFGTLSGILVPNVPAFSKIYPGLRWGQGLPLYLQHTVLLKSKVPK